MIVILGSSLYIFITSDINTLRPSYQGKFTISIFRDYNMMVVSLLSSLFLFMIKRKSNVKNYIIFLIFIVIIIVLGVYSGSRRSIIVYFPIAISVSFYFIIGFNFQKFIKSFLVILCGLIIMITLVYSVDQDKMMNQLDNQYSALESRFNRGVGLITGDYDDTSSRTERWENAMIVYNNSTIVELFIGKGHRSYFNNELFIREDGSRDSPHNFILSELIQGGIVKIFILGIFLFILIVDYKRNKNHIDLWSKVYINSFLLIWSATVFISGLGFLTSKQFFLYLLGYLIIVYKIPNKVQVKGVNSAG